MVNSYEKSYAEQFRSSGELPRGPVSPWPRGREIRALNSFINKTDVRNENEIKPTFKEMATGMLRTGGQALHHGKCSTEVRTERMETCMSCEHFLPNEQRCSLCGCYMKAKTWVGGDPKRLCPAKKWVR